MSLTNFVETLCIFVSEHLLAVLTLALTGQSEIRYAICSRGARAP